MLEVQSAQDRLVQAEFNVGRARHIVRESGFPDVFRPMTRTKPSPTFKFGSTQFHLRTFELFADHTMQNIASLQIPNIGIIVSLSSWIECDFFCFGLRVSVRNLYVRLL